MSQVIPEGWVETSLGKLSSDISYGYTAKSTSLAVGPQMLRITDIQNNRVNWSSVPYCEIDVDLKAKYLLEKGDLLFARTGATVGKSFLIREDNPESVYASYLIRVRCFPSAHIDYLSYFFLGPDYWDQITDMSSGIGQPSVNGTKLKGLALPLPPLAEQKVIANKLDELLAQVESTKARLDAIPAILKSFRQSVLAAAVSGKLTEEWRGEKTKLPNSEMLLTSIKKERFESWVSHELEKKKAKGIKPKDDKWKDKYPEPLSNYSDPLQRTRIDEIPESWLKTNLDTVSIMTTGKTPSTTNEANWNGELPFISPAQVHKNGHILEPVRYVSELGSKTVPVVVKNSILIVCIGTVGKVGVLDSDAVINQQLNAITPLPMVLSRYMFYWSKNLYPWIIETSRATVNAAIINKSRLSEAPFALPSLEEQAEIVRRVEELFAFADKVEAQVNAAQLRVNNLTQSILAKAFRGELTADWRAANPELISGDNSAEALLEKIKVERQSMQGKKTRKKA
ncbi:restriction endonuclease subunit S [Shewanella sp.]|uniref:restriction endonuclease subunit S n=1 Tax=Shewanella sp. TaxID=50422 RepID=UPI001B792042|nr:restriction endonuclease subunit S [Shewanella sp.]MBP6518275.1 restriction endonuclease subunit S [Shewanella sp.]